MKKPNDDNTKGMFSANISTYTDSYRIFKDVRTERFRYERDNTENSTFKHQPTTSLDMETFTPFKHKIPMDLMVVPNDVTGRNALAPIQHIGIPEDDMKEEVIKTRPRLLKSPQISLDDVPDPEMRKMLLKYTYTSDSKQTELDLWNMLGIDYREVPETVVERDKFLTISKKHYSAIYFEPKSLLQIEMSPEQNLKGSHWEKERLVGTTKSTEHFWKHNKPRYGSSNSNVFNLVDKKTLNEISNLVDKDQLEVQHDKTCPSYTGYKSSVAVGIDLQKKDIPHHHPQRSTYQEAFSWKYYPKDNFKTI